MRRRFRRTLDVEPIKVVKVVKTVKSPSGKVYYIVLDDSKHYWVTSDKTGHGGGVLEFSQSAAERTLNSWVKMDELNKKYGEKEGYKRWMAGKDAKFTPSKVMEEVAKKSRMQSKYIEESKQPDGKIALSSKLGDPIAMYDPKTGKVIMYDNLRGKNRDSKIVKVEKGNKSKYLVLKGKRDDIIRVESSLSLRNEGIPEYFKLKNDNKDFQEFENNGWKVKLFKDSKPKNGLYVVMKNGKYAEDFSEGKRLTTSYNKAEKFTSPGAALKAAKDYGEGFKMVTLKMKDGAFDDVNIIYLVKEASKLHNLGKYAEASYKLKDAEKLLTNWLKMLSWKK